MDDKSRATMYTEVGTAGAEWALANRSEGRGDSLYAGLAGVTLAALEAAATTGDHRFAEAAADCADVLASNIDGADHAGLYVGVAGTAAVLLECHRILDQGLWTGDIRRIVEFLDRAAQPAGRGRTWSSVTDIVSGTAGTGLALLAVHDRLGDEHALSLALDAADALAAAPQEVAGGLSWAMDPAFPRIMPNFSHGTAGVAYFLAAAGRAAGRDDLLDVALKGAGHLLTLATGGEDTCLVHHNSPDGEDLFYLGWCHGPVGTARLFELLFQITGDTTWRTWVERCARALVRSGIPAHRPDGFWQNVGQCCGNAGVLEFCLDLGARTDLTGELSQLGRELADDICTRASRDDDGCFWVHVENRTKPDELASQPGFMQGAAGVAVALLRYGSHLENGGVGSPRLQLPDNPFSESRNS